VTDAELLRAYEPILRFTEGELFFPSHAAPYIAECDLWQGRSERESTLVVPYGELTPQVLANVEAPPGERLFLRFVQRPLSGVELARWRARPDRPSFQAPGRLARVGLFARIVDAGFNLSLLLRGTVPGGTALAAWAKYHRMAEDDPRPVYHGRVVREDGWIVLQYLFFYVMNDWRTHFGGANDHEADWEQVFVYLEDRPEGPRPVWCAAAAHESRGDDLRRRWDDPDLHRDGDHPVLYVGAGSHATYFEPGEYVTTVPVPGYRPVRGLLEAVRVLWRDVLRQVDPGDLAVRLRGWLSVPFIDYARGDGRAIGPGAAQEWTAVPLGEEVPWVSRYRGLFGLDTYDRFAGERAPAGPKFARDGTVRRSWYDPLGWAGLAKSAPPGRAARVLRSHIAGLAAEAERLRVAEREEAARLPGLQLELEALSHGVAPGPVRDATAAEVARTERALAETRRALAALGDRTEAAEDELARVEAGDFGDPRDHLRSPYRPMPAEVRRYGIVVELWSALGFGLLLLGMIAVAYFTDVGAWGAAALALAVYVALESAFHRRVLRLMLWVTLGLALVAAAILVWEFALQLLIAAVVAVAILTIMDNLRELRRGRT
jgi:hypothetical protein